MNKSVLIWFQDIANLRLGRTSDKTMINNFSVDHIDVFFLSTIFGISNLIFTPKVVMKILRLSITKATGTVFPSYLEIYANALLLFFFNIKIES